VAWTLAGETTYAVCQWAAVIVIAKLGNATMVGQYALGLAITAPIMILYGLSLRALQGTDAASQYEFQEYLALRFITTGMAFVLIVGVCVAGRYAAETALIIVGIGMAKSLESISDIFYGFFQRHERMDLISTSMLIKGPLSLLGIIVGLYLSDSVVGAVIGLIAAWAAVLLLYDARQVKRQVALNTRGPAVDVLSKRSRLWSLARKAWPLGITVMLVSLNLNVPRYFIDHYFGEREVGIFAALAHLLFVGSTIMNAFGQSASPRLARYWANQSRTAFRQLLIKLVAVAGVLGVGGITAALWIGRDLLTVLYRPEYAAHVDVLAWLMVAAVFSYLASALGYVLTAARVLWLQPLQMSCVTAAGCIGCMLFIPRYGLQGAAWAMVTSMVIQLIIATGGTAFLLGASKRTRKPISEVAFRLP
jgi:O-antigen/teichoic acid export membrane protein